MNVGVHFVVGEACGVVTGTGVVEGGTGEVEDRDAEGGQGGLVVASSSKRSCKLSLTGTAKRSTIRGGGRWKAQILICISGGRRAN